VIAGNSEAVDRACEILKAKGAKRAIKLNVSAPFHCELMKPAEERLAADLQELKYGDFRFAVVHNIDAEANDDSAKVADA
jgi:[acyl-carrier-protein] S-malonyltransferase